MKIYYAAATVVLSIVLIIMLAAHLNFKSSEPDKILRKTPREASLKYPVPQEQNRSSNIPQMTVIWEKNLFLPSRGAQDKGEAVADKAKHSDLELVGICKFGAVSGAIIVNKNRAQENIVPPAQGTLPAQMKAQQAQGAKPEKRYFQQGQRMSSGYLLKEIHNDHVVLSRGNEEVILKLQFGDESSNKRLASMSFKPVEKSEPVSPSGETISAPPIQDAKPDQSRPALPAPPPPPPMGIKTLKQTS